MISDCTILHRNFKKSDKICWSLYSAVLSFIKLTNCLQKASSALAPKPIYIFWLSQYIQLISKLGDPWRRNPCETTDSWIAVQNIGFNAYNGQPTDHDPTQAIKLHRKRLAKRPTIV